MDATASDRLLGEQFSTERWTTRCYQHRLPLLTTLLDLSAAEFVTPQLRFNAIRDLSSLVQAGSAGLRSAMRRNHGILLGLAALTTAMPDSEPCARRYSVDEVDEWRRSGRRWEARGAAAGRRRRRSGPRPSRASAPRGVTPPPTSWSPSSGPSTWSTRRRTWARTSSP